MISENVEDWPPPPELKTQGVSRFSSNPPPIEEENRRNGEGGGGTPKSIQRVLVVFNHGYFFDN